MDILTAYQDFRRTIPPETLRELRGKSFVAEFRPANGWQILRSDEDDEHLTAWLLDNNIDLASVVLDQVPAEPVVGGAQLL